MSWLPEFHAGVWNAWIPMLIFPLNPLLLIAIDKAVGNGEIFKKMGAAPTGKEEKRTNTIYTIVLVLMLAYAIFLPLKVGTAWFYAGLAVFLQALAVLLSAIVTAAKIPAGRLFTQGIYQYSRHPMYLALVMIPFAAGIASASWVFLLLSIIHAVIHTATVKAEEQDCVEMFGGEYLEYMRRTPRWIGTPRPD